MKLNSKLSLGLSYAATGVGSSSPGLLDLYSTYMVFGDGVMSEGSAGGLRNGPTQFLWAMAGRVRPSLGWMQCKSGGDLDTCFARINAALVQVVAIAHFASQGHNDGLLGTDPVASPSLFNKWKRNLDAFVAAHNGRAGVILIDNTLPSNVTENFKAQVWAAQLNYIATIVPSGGTLIVARDLSGFDPLNMTPAGDSGRVHPDERGGWWLGADPGNPNSIFSKVDPLVTAATIDDIANDTAAKSWRGANLYTDYNLAGTTGTKNGAGVTPVNAVNAGADVGGYATNHTITNALANGSGVTVGVGKDTSPNPYDVQQVDIAGTAAARNTITEIRSNYALTGSVPGAAFAFQAAVKIDDGAGNPPDGLVAFGALFQGGIGNNGGDPTTGVTAPFDHVIDTVLMTAPAVIFGPTYPVNSAQQLITRWEGSVALDGRIRHSRHQIYQTELDEVGVPAYIGDDTIVSANLRLRVTGTGISGTTVTAATVGAVRLEPGRWCNGSADWSACFTRAVRLNGAPWSGHQFPSGWTDTWTGLLSAGNTIDIDLTMTNSKGSSTKTLSLTVV